MRTITLACITVLVLAGCASQKLNSGLPRLTGKTLDYAISYLGYPDSEQTIAGKKVYTWGHGSSVTMMQTYRTPVSGTAYGAGGGIYYQGHQTSVVPQTYNFQCMIRLIADQNGLVERWEWNGNEGGCEHYSGAMSRLIADTQ